MINKKTKRKGSTKIPRITYATLKVTPQDDKAYDDAVVRVRTKLGGHFAMLINGKERFSAEEMAHASPVDTRAIVSYFPKGTRDDVKSAIAAARQAYPNWAAMPYSDRIAILRKAAELMIERRYELSAWMAFEVGKNRSESLAEVNEAAELIRYYCDQMLRNKGFLRPLESPGPGQKTYSVLRPYGVWAVIGPWNFPFSLAAGMSAGALIAGNTVVFKPSSDSPVLGFELCRAFVDAGLPPGVFNFVTGPGEQLGLNCEIIRRLMDLSSLGRRT